VHGSVTNSTLLRDLFSRQRFDYVYHLAAYAAEGLSHYIRRFNYNTNLIGTVNLVNEAVKAQTKCFVFTSSIAVYGKGQLPMQEDMIPRPEDPYGIGKYAAELDLAAAFEHFGLRYVVFRPHNVYGEHQNFADPYRNVLGIFMNQILRGEPLTIFGDGEQTRAFTYIDDVAPHIAGSVHNPQAWNQVFNIGADCPYTVNVLAQVVAEAFDTELNIKYLPARKEVVHAYASHEKVASILCAEPRISLEEGVKRMAQWVRSVGSRASKPFDAIEIYQNMPPSWAASTSLTAVQEAC
jgi:UDP-glucose 4-epimerase